jgi:hypothetical protein
MRLKTTTHFNYVYSFFLTFCRRWGSRWRPELYKIDGLNSQHYTLVSFNKYPLITHMKVNLALPTKELILQHDRITKKSKPVDYKACRMYNGRPP